MTKLVKSAIRSLDWVGRKADAVWCGAWRALKWLIPAAAVTGTLVVGSFS